MFKLWVDTKKYRNKLTSSFDEVRVHDCFNKEQKNMKEYIDADELWVRLNQLAKHAESIKDLMNDIETELAKDN